jgi:hypothetical protein
MKTNKYKKPFVMTTVERPFALLPGIGRFCKLEGCNNQLVGKKVTRIRKGKKQSYFLEPRENQEYCSIQHKQRAEYLRSKTRNVSNKREIRTKYDYMKNGLKTLIDLNIKYDQNLIAFRTMKIIFGNTKVRTDSLEIKITRQDNLTLWNICDKIVRYTKSTSILPEPDLSQTVNSICAKIPQVEI